MSHYVSLNCREEPCGPCTGCSCPHHEIPAPPNLRELAGLDPKPEPEEDR